MDNFLHLVPMENDGDSDTGLVYGDDDELVGVGDAAAAAAALFDAVTTSTTTTHETDVVLHHHHQDDDDEEEATAMIGSTEEDEEEEETEQEHEEDQDEECLQPYYAAMEQQQYLKRARMLQKAMDEANDELERRLSCMKRILSLAGPMEQLSEYVALMIDEETTRDDTIEITSELVECARQMRDPDDRDVALMAAFVFLCDPPKTSTKATKSSLLPIVAAMMEAAQRTGFGLTI